MIVITLHSETPAGLHLCITIKKVSKMKKKKDKAMLTIGKGEKLADQLVETLFTVAPDIDGAVAMTYALSKAYVVLKSALKEFGINVDPYFRNMVKMWEDELK